MADRKLIVEFVGDDRSLQRTITRSTQALDKFGKQTGSSTGSTGRVPIRSTGADEFLEETRAMRRRADEVVEQERRIQEQTDKTRQSLQKAAVIGAGAFAFGRALSGTGAALEVVTGGTSEWSTALGDAGNAVSAIVTLNPEGFFKSVGGGAQRTKQHFLDYAESVKDANQAGEALEKASIARALGLNKEAEAIERNVTALKNMAAAQAALDFSARKQNVVTGADGRQGLVRFRGAGAAEDIRGGLRGAGGVETIQVDVTLDGEKVGQSTTKQQQKSKARNGRQKRGPNSSFR